MPVDFDTRKTVAILAYLAVEQKASRETLTGLLWAESASVRARATLRRTLSSIMKGIGLEAIVTILALIYVVGAVWLPTQLRGEQSPLFVAGATLAAASLFNPVRRRVIDRVDHRFNRSRYDAQYVISEFNERLRDQIEVDQITADSDSVITRTMQPASVVVRVRQ